MSQKEQPCLRTVPQFPEVNSNGCIRNNCAVHIDSQVSISIFLTNLQGENNGNQFNVVTLQNIANRVDSDKAGSQAGRLKKENQNKYISLLLFEHIGINEQTGKT